MRSIGKKFPHVHPATPLLAVILMMVLSLPAFPQGKYRTFSQDDLHAKKAKAGKVIYRTVSFRFHNSSFDVANSLHVKLNAKTTSVVDSGGFTTLTESKGEFTFTGRTVARGDSVRLAFVTTKKKTGTGAKDWFWDSLTVKGAKNGPLSASTDIPTQVQPNGGNVLGYLYKNVIDHNGVVVGLVSTATGVHWIRYIKADSKFFPHTGTPTCLNFVSPKKELKNPKVEKFNDHLVGEVHALELAIIASDNGVTRPDTPANRLGNLLYQVTGDPLDGMTVRAIVHFADSALTYCGTTFSATLAHIDSVVSRINGAFGGPYTAVSFTPLVIAGTVDLSTVTFLHTNPNAEPVTVARPTASVIEAEPDMFALYQNYPNPFNPTTTIQFDLTQQTVVTLKIYNVLGQEVATLLNNESMDAGQQEVEFDASQLASGLYLYRISGEGFMETKKMMLMK